MVASFITFDAGRLACFVCIGITQMPLYLATITEGNLLSVWLADPYTISIGDAPR